jgi:hypothetical protein
MLLFTPGEQHFFEGYHGPISFKEQEGGVNPALLALIARIYSIEKIRFQRRHRKRRDP